MAYLGPEPVTAGLADMRTSEHLLRSLDAKDPSFKGDIGPTYGLHIGLLWQHFGATCLFKTPSSQNKVHNRPQACLIWALFWDGGSIEGGILGAYGCWDLDTQGWLHLSRMLHLSRLRHIQAPAWTSKVCQQIAQHL